jgi:hypothetical protein
VSSASVAKLRLSEVIQSDRAIDFRLNGVAHCHWFLDKIVETASGYMYLFECPIIEQVKEEWLDFGPFGGFDG